MASRTRSRKRTQRTQRRRTQRSRKRTQRSTKARRSCGSFQVGKTYKGHLRRSSGAKKAITAKVVSCTKNGQVLIKEARGNAFPIYKYRGKWVYGSGAYPIVLKK